MDESEALTNVARHSGAHAVRVEVERGNTAGTVRVTDDGVSFVPDAAGGGQASGS